MWESHADADDRIFVKPAPEKTRSVYTVSEPAVMPADRVVADVATPSLGLADLEMLLRRLLPSVPAPLPRPVPAEIEIVWECLLSSTLALVPVSPSRSATMGMETMLRRLLLPGTATPAPRSNPVPVRRDWTSVVCFSCGKPGHGVSRCPQLDETFPYMLPGWSAEKVDGKNMMISPRMFERMCVTEPQFRDRLRPCRRRLVLADSSPLLVCGELCMTVVFPGLQCGMTLAIASIGSERLLGMEVLQSCLPHQLNLRTGRWTVHIAATSGSLVPCRYPAGSL